MARSGDAVPAWKQAILKSREELPVHPSVIHKNTASFGQGQSNSMAALAASPILRSRSLSLTMPEVTPIKHQMENSDTVLNTSEPRKISFVNPLAPVYIDMQPPTIIKGYKGLPIQVKGFTLNAPRPLILVEQTKLKTCQENSVLEESTGNFFFIPSFVLAHFYYYYYIYYYPIIIALYYFIVSTIIIIIIIIFVGSCLLFPTFFN